MGEEIHGGVIWPAAKRKARDSAGNRLDMTGVLYTPSPSPQDDLMPGEPMHRRAVGKYPASDRRHRG